MKTEEFYQLDPQTQDNLASYLEEFHMIQANQAQTVREQAQIKQPSAQELKNIAAQKTGKLSKPLSPFNPQDVLGAMPTQQGQAGGTVSRRGPQRVQGTPEEAGARRAEAALATKMGGGG